MFINYMIPILLIALAIAIGLILLIAFRKNNAKQDIILRFWLVITIIASIFALVIARILYLQLSDEGKYLREYGEKTINSVPDTIYGKRGNILSDDDRLLASSIPTYRVYMDMRVDAFKVKKVGKKYKMTTIDDPDNFFNQNVDSLAYMLSQKFGEKSKAQYKADLLKAFRTRNPKYQFINHIITYTDYLELKKFPILRRNKYQSGLITEERMTREKPFGTLASRTIGNIYGISAKGGSSGLELEYNDYLKGDEGIVIRRKMAGKRTEIELVAPEDGCDIRTTINIDIQEVAERSLRQVLTQFNCELGCAILMETQTGKIKAISNLHRNGEGNYVETSNFAASGQIEPGSTFKTMSCLVALEDHYIDTTVKVDTKQGRIQFGDRIMRDWNDKGDGKGGFGIATLGKIMEQSSNTGISFLIDSLYKNQKQKYLDGIVQTGITDSIHIEIPGHGNVKMKEPGSKDWYGTTLPWMSIGYEIQVPPIHMLMFYNAIANDGKMVKPMFVTEILRKGNVVRSMDTEVVKSKICSNSTLRQLQGMLERVVLCGTAKPVQSKLFTIAGKTGTAQVVGENGKYKDAAGHTTHQITFVGYFPADKPQYTCLVLMKTKGVASAGWMCGRVFRDIAEKAYIMNGGNAPELDDETKACDIDIKDIMKIEEQEIDSQIATLLEKYNR